MSRTSEGPRNLVARHRVASASLAIVVVAAAVATVIATTRSTSRPKVVASTKVVTLAQLVRFDAAVVLPADATNHDVGAMRDLLDKSDAVERYATLPAATLVTALVNEPSAADQALRARVCAAPSTLSFAIELNRTAADALQRLTAGTGKNATVVSTAKPGVDVEIFMAVYAPPAQVTAVRAQVSRDPDVTRYAFLDHEAAYKSFVKLFSDQPGLAKSESPRDLPESFQLELRDNVRPTAVAARFQHLPGVNFVDTPADLGSVPSLPASVPSGQAQIFMKVRASESQIAAVHAQLDHDPRVKSSRYLDHAAAYAEFKRLFANQPVIVENETASGLPTSYHVILRRNDDAEALQHDYQSLPGIEQIQIPHTPLEAACAAKR